MCFLIYFSHAVVGFSADEFNGDILRRRISAIMMRIVYFCLGCFLR